jgi:hypothetical protein
MPQKFALEKAADAGSGKAVSRCRRGKPFTFLWSLIQHLLPLPRPPLIRSWLFLGSLPEGGG